MKKIQKAIVVLVTLVIFVGIFPSAVFAAGNVYYVAKNGNNGNNGSAGSPWLTIDTSIGKLQPGDTLIISEGTYNEKLDIQKSGTADNYITIKGEEGKQVILDGIGISARDSAMIYLENRSYVRIENLEICNLNTSGTNSGIHINTGTNSNSTSVGIQLVNNKIHNIDGESKNSNKDNKNGHGIVVHGRGTSSSGAVRDLLIEGNEVYGCFLGNSEAVVVNGNVVGWEIKNNYIHDNDNIGIDAIGGEKDVCSSSTYNRARNGIVSGNVLVNNNNNNNPAYDDKTGADGIYVDGGRDIVIKNNYISNSFIGIEVSTENDDINRPSGIVIQNNVVLGYNHNESMGILLGGGDGALDVLTEHNTVYMTRGPCIEIENGSGPYTIKNNIFLATSNSAYYEGTRSASFSYNIYHGKTSGKPPIDTTGQIVQTLPVEDLNCFLPKEAYNSYGASLSVASTPFINIVVSCGHVEPERIEVNPLPTKTQYFVGEALDLSGMVVTAYYSDGSEKNVTSSASTAPANGTTLNTIGEQEVKITYTENGVTKSFSFEITVVEKPSVEDLTFTIENIANVRAGQSVEVPILVSNNPGVALIRVNINLHEDLEWDCDLSVYDGGDQSTWPFIGSNDVLPISITGPYSIEESASISFIGSGGNKQGNGTLVTLKLKVKEGAEPGEKPIEVEIPFCRNENEGIVPHNVKAGKITVVNFIYGDVNGDRIVDDLDYLKLTQYVNGWPVQIDDGADVNGDGRVDDLDYLILTQYVNGWPVILGPKP